VWAEAGRALFFLFAAGVSALNGALAADPLHIGAPRGVIDFSIGESRIFRTTGSFSDWLGQVVVDDVDVTRSRVEVTVRTASITMLDKQQTAMMKEAEFFNVAQFPEMTYRSRSAERTGENKLRVFGDVTLRGITRPMQLDVTVSDLKPDAPIGARYARFRAAGSIKRSEFGMTRFIDVVGDKVDITIRTDAWR
jgi:polyisoprenoid-binding protein YceI